MCHHVSTTPNGVQHDVKKAYYTDAGLRSQRGQEYECDDNGWVTPKMSDTSNQSADGTQS